MSSTPSAPIIIDGHFISVAALIVPVHRQLRLRVQSHALKCNVGATVADFVVAGCGGVVENKCGCTGIDLYVRGHAGVDGERCCENRDGDEGLHFVVECSLIDWRNVIEVPETGNQ